MEKINLVDLVHGTSNRDHGRVAGMKIIEVLNLLHIKKMSECSKGKILTEEEMLYYKKLISINIDIIKEQYFSASFLDEVIQILSRSQFLNQVTFSIYDEKTQLMLKSISNFHKLNIHVHMNGDNHIIKPSEESYIEIIYEDL